MGHVVEAAAMETRFLEVVDYGLLDRMLAEGAAGDYRTAKPFPHIMIDGLLPEEVARAAEKEVSASDIGREKTTYSTFEKYRLSERDLIGPVAGSIIDELNSPRFCSYLERLERLTRRRTSRGLGGERALFGPGLCRGSSDRIYAVLIPALLLTAALDRLGQTFFPQAHYYDAGNAILHGRFDVPFVNGSSLPTFLCNLVQVQPIRCSIYGSDIPLWSLSYEVLYYACAGALALAIQRRGWTMALPFVLAGWLLFVLGVSGIFLSIPWVFGALIYLFQQRAEGKNKSRAIALMLAGAALFLASRVVHVPVGQNVTLGHLLAGIAFGLALIGTGEISRLRTPQGKPAPAKRFYRFNLAMSDFSYSLYLIHFPVLVLYFSVVTAAGGLGGPMGHRLTMSNVSIVAVGILLALFVAWSFGRLFERNTWKLRRLLGSKRPRKDSPVNLTLGAGP